MFVAAARNIGVSVLRACACGSARGSRGEARSAGHVPVRPGVYRGHSVPDELRRISEYNTTTLGVFPARARYRRSRAGYPWPRDSGSHGPSVGLKFSNMFDLLDRAGL